jgi:hypothetical protein
MSNKTGKDNEDLPIGRKIFKDFKKGRYYPINVPTPLSDALKKCDLKYSIVLKKAIIMLKKYYDGRKFDEFAHVLRYNPPPKSDKNVRVSFTFLENKHYEFVKKILKEDFPYVRNTTDFILRSISYYLREKGYLEKID